MDLKILLHGTFKVAECHKQATVIVLSLIILGDGGVTKYCQQSIDDRHLYDGLSAQLCVQHDGCKASFTSY